MEETQLIEEAYNIPDHPFGDNINVIFTNDINGGIQHQCDRYEIDSEYYLTKHADATVISLREDGVGMLAVIFDVDKINDRIILHECVHLARYVILPRGIEFNEHTDEIYAYYIEWLFKNIKELYNQYLNK